MRTGPVSAGLTQPRVPLGPSLGTCRQRHLKTGRLTTRSVPKAAAVRQLRRCRPVPGRGPIPQPGPSHPQEPRLGHAATHTPPLGEVRRHVSSPHRGGRGRGEAPRVPPADSSPEAAAMGGPRRAALPRPTCYSGHYDITVPTAPRW